MPALQHPASYLTEPLGGALIRLSSNQVASEITAAQTAEFPDRSSGLLLTGRESNPGLLLPATSALLASCIQALVPERQLHLEEMFGRYKALLHSRAHEGQ